MAEIQFIKINKFEKKPTDSDDPLASEVSWRPVDSGGANFKTQSLKLRKNKIFVKKSLGAILFASGFLLLGFIALFIAAPLAYFAEDVAATFFRSLWGAACVGASWYFFSRRNFQFDKTAGVYFKGKKFEPKGYLPIYQQGYLENIHALQLLSKQGPSNSDHVVSNYLIYELNLVFKTGGRANVMDFLNEKDLEKSAIKLADFLNVPIWKAIY